MPATLRKSGAPLSASLARVRRLIPVVASEAAVEAVRRLVLECFRGQHDPDGSRWPPRADGTGRPLLLTIGDALEFWAEQGTVYVECPTKPHADYQFWGTRTIPSRRWSPPPGMPMPMNWQREVNRAVKKALSEVLRFKV